MDDSKKIEKRQRWVGVAPRRVEQIRRRIALFERCANAGTYAYEESEVEAIFDVLTRDLMAAREAFRPKQRKLGPTFTAADMTRPALSDG